jgi:hypothetical protein
MFFSIAVVGLVGYMFGNSDKHAAGLTEYIQSHAFLFRVCIASVLILILCYINFHITKKEPKIAYSELAKFTASGLVVIGFFYSILTFEFNVKKSKLDKRAQMAQSTFNILSAWNTTPLIDHHKTIDTFEKSDKHALLKENIDEFMVYYNSDSIESIELRKAIRGIFNYFEIITSGITEGVIDEAFVKRYLSEVALEYYNDWNNFIGKRREKNPTVFIEFTNLVETWNEQKL